MTPGDAALEMCHRRSGEILKAIERTDERITKKLDELNGSVGENTSRLDRTEVKQEAHEVRIGACETRVDSLRMTFAKKVGQGTVLVGVASLVAYILKLFLG